jgi:transketolase
MSNNISEEELKFLEWIALQLRIDSLRATTEAGSGHPTSCLSIAEIIAALFFHQMRFKVDDPDFPTNDRIVLSKAHAVPIIYAAYKHLGVLKDEELMQLRKFNSPLEGHPTARWRYHDASTGSLGQGLGIVTGMAWGTKNLEKNNATQFYTILGDGESCEGSVWESACLAAHYKLNNITAFVDCNGLGQTGWTVHGHQCEGIRAKFEAFGWQAEVIADGNDMRAVVNALAKPMPTDRPRVFVARTIKGKGLETVEDKFGFHGKPCPPDKLDHAIKLLHERTPHLANYSPPKYTPLAPPPPPPPLRPAAAAAKKEARVNLNLADDPNAGSFAKKDGAPGVMSTRKAFGYGLLALGRMEERIVVLDGDVSNSTFTDMFAKAMPERFIQGFIAEQNVASMAVGLASRPCRRVPFMATFAAFWTRAFDQLRMAAIGRVPLRVAGTHVGLATGEDGASQSAFEDLGVFRSLPKSVVLYPSDAVSAYYLVQDMMEYNKGISYMRLARIDTPILYKPTDMFTIGGSHVLRTGPNDQMCLVAAGVTLHEALAAHDELKRNGNIDVSVIDLYSIKPLDRQSLLDLANKSSTRRMLVIEDHYQPGGIFEAVSAEMAAERHLSIHSLCVRDVPRSGKSEELLREFGIDKTAIVSTVKELLRSRQA